MEEMGAFFNARIHDYDTKHIENIDGQRACYDEIPAYLPKSIKSLIDFGCGTGIELEEIFKLYPDLRVTGIDLAGKMLERLKEKFTGRNIQTIQGNYLDFESKEQYDAALSVMTLHHYCHEEKQLLFSRIFDTLDNDGLYIDCDYMVATEEEERFYHQEYQRLCQEQELETGVYHFDRPCAVHHEKELLASAGFGLVEEVWKTGNTVILVAKKRMI